MEKNMVSKIVGKITRLDSSIVQGWVHRPDHPEEIVSVRVLLDDRLIEVIEPSLPRWDVSSDLPAQRGRAFIYSLSPLILDGLPHLLRFLAGEEDTELEGSPLAVHHLWESRTLPFQLSDMTGRRVLVLAPHPDDETLGCGGSLIKHVQAGDPVQVLFITRGSRGGFMASVSGEEYASLREKEALQAGTLLGIRDMVFWSYEDRGCQGQPDLQRKLEEAILKHQPELIYAPSPGELHPDHQAVAHALWRCLQNHPMDADILFYETVPPQPINVLVDISDQMSSKLEACRAYKSQLLEMPYDDIIAGLNRYRAASVHRHSRFAEGFMRVTAGYFRDHEPFNLQALPPGEMPMAEQPLVSLIVRTRDRRKLLGEALQSITLQTWRPIEVIVINDGGRDVSDEIERFKSALPIEYHAPSRSVGRAAAGNLGLKRARGTFVGFLDDDDLLYPQHLEKLAGYLEASGRDFAYSDCEIGRYRWEGQGFHLQGKKKLFRGIDFDLQKLYSDNYIPIMTALFRRSLLERAGCMDETFQVFEDWDLWLRFAQHTAFQRLPGITAEYRQIGDSPYDYMSWRVRIYAKYRQRAAMRHMETLKDRQLNALVQQRRALMEQMARIDMGINAVQLEVPARPRRWFGLPGLWENSKNRKQPSSPEHPLKGQKIAIFGIYKSGTTGMFYKIRNSLPLDTRTLFEPQGYTFDEQDKNGIVLAKVILGIPDKNHTVDYASFIPFDKKIYLIRDPRDWLISGALFLIQQEREIYENEATVREILELLRRKEENPGGIQFLEIFGCILSHLPGRTLQGTFDWIAELHQWLFDFERRLDDSVRIRYEDFVDGDLETLEKYLGQPLTGSAAVDAEHDHVPRTQNYGNWKNWFLPKDVAVLKPLLQEYLDRYGYSSDWTCHQNPKIDPEHSSLYVERVVKKRRGT
jgi:LmbE family N-acetylglucosaminyl deacetylase/glycosyltransferase involved in cell wall biosynthesis